MQSINQKLKLLRIMSATIIVSMLILSGCGTLGPKAPAYPRTEKAQFHYRAGNLAMKQGRYEVAINEFKRSISLETASFMPHAWLATAYFTNQNFAEAALEFQNVTGIVGGVEFGGPFPIMQALSLMRSGDTVKAQELLRYWSTPSIMMTGLGTAYYTGSGKPQGIWKVAAAYLLGGVTEDKYLRKAPQEDLTFPYLIIGINNIVKNNFSKARGILSRQLVISGEGRWSHAIAKAELEWLNQKKQ